MAHSQPVAAQSGPDCGARNGPSYAIQFLRTCRGERDNASPAYNVGGSWTYRDAGYLTPPDGTKKLNQEKPESLAVHSPDPTLRAVGYCFIKRMRYNPSQALSLLLDPLISDSAATVESRFRGVFAFRVPRLVTLSLAFMDMPNP